MLIDANILLYAADATAREHARAASWLTDQLNGTTRVGMPWESLSAFLRISTHPRASVAPLHPNAAWRFVDEWLAAPPVWIPQPTDRHQEILGRMVVEQRISGNLLPDAHLAAIAVGHGLELCSADTDFARFPEVRWRNPLVG